MPLKSRLRAAAGSRSPIGSPGASPAPRQRDLRTEQVKTSDSAIGDGPLNTEGMRALAAGASA
jgi:hypothetical protein